MADPLFPPEVAALQREASQFALGLREEAARREWQPDPAARVPWQLVAEASRRGWRMLGPPHRGFAGAREILRESAIEAAATTLGTARAAYEMALRHTCQRRQGGRPLAEHANVRARLGRMHAQLEAARSLMWRAAIAVESDDYDHRLGASAKLVAADTAVAVCQSAMELHGGLAIMYQECGVEKCLRDCLSFLHSDGAQDSLALRVADLSVALLRDGRDG